ncbi:DUF4328 domain-containing protein [Nonomuraea sp. NPDC002799]
MHPPPPAYPPHVYPPPPPPLRPVRGPAIFAVVALAGVAVVGLVAAVIDLWYAALVDRLIEDPSSVPDSEITTGDLVYAASGILEALSYVLAAVAFLVWLFRVRSNAEILSPDGHRRSRPWVIFGWVVPIIAFWFPKQVVDDIWHASTRAAAPSKGLINGWWAAWLVHNIVTNVAGRLLNKAGDLDALASAARFDAFDILLMIIAAGLAIGVVRKITDAQEDTRAAAAAGVMPGSPGMYQPY